LFAWSLISLSAPVAAAPAATLTLVDPFGAVLSDGEHPLPHAEDHPLSLGRRDYVLAASLDAAGALTLTLSRVRGSKRKVVAESRVALTQDTDGALRLEADAPRRATDPAGQPVDRLSWSARARWVDLIAAPPAGGAPEGKARYVLLWTDGALSPDPRFGQWAPFGPEHGRDRPEAQLTPFRVVMEFTNQILEVEAVPEAAAGPHCYFQAAEHNAWEKQFFTRVGELAAVTTREIALTFDDGSGATLGAGVAVRPLEGDRYRVEVDDLRVEVALPEDAVSWFYRPGARFPDADGPPLPAEADAIGLLGGAPVRDLSGGRPAAGREGVRQPVWVVQTACAELRLVGYE